MLRGCPPTAPPLNWHACTTPHKLVQVLHQGCTHLSAAQPGSMPPFVPPSNSGCHMLCGAGGPASAEWDLPHNRGAYP
jgi:hypothetical protein